MTRIAQLILALGFALALALPGQAAPVESFDAFVRNFEAKAIAAGVPRPVYRAAMDGLTEDPKIPGLIVGQPEFTTPIWDYMDKRVSADRIARGQAAIKRNAALFESVGQRYGVDPYILGAIWGMETDYGAVLNNSGLIKPIIRSLATLVHQRRGRLEADEAELIAALKLVAATGQAPASLVGSWAGAIGHLQVTPSVILAHGQDGDGDGRVDPHGSLADALATSAMFIRSMNYQPGIDWGFEVALPEGFDYLLAQRDVFRPISFYVERGVTRASGRAFTNPGQEVFLYVPAGKDGPKFLMTPNYLVLKGYNFSDSYAMSVAHMADRLKGAGPFRDDWPRKEELPSRDEIMFVQQALRSSGLLEGMPDGRIGPKTQEAFARYQKAIGEVPDGFVSKANVELLRKNLL